jgi:cGMP-dependent protein kinase
MSVAFPFIIQMVKTFKDQDMLMYLLEYIEGVDLFEVLKEIGLLSTFDCQFYIANIILILEYLHSNYIMARDIKP